MRPIAILVGALLLFRIGCAQAQDDQLPVCDTASCPSDDALTFFSVSTGARYALVLRSQAGPDCAIRSEIRWNAPHLQRRMPSLRSDAATILTLGAGFAGGTQSIYLRVWGCGAGKVASRIIRLDRQSPDHGGWRNVRTLTSPPLAPSLDMQAAADVASERETRTWH